MMTETGMRPGEVFGLRWQDVSLEECRLRVNQALEFTGKGKGEEGPRFVFGPPKTELSARVIEFSQELADSLKEHRQNQEQLRLRAGRRWEEHDLVFTTNRGTHRNPANELKAFKKLCVSAGLPERTLYAARHTTGSILLPNGATVKEVQELLGHSTAKLTLDTYAHALPGSGRKVSDLMSGIIRRQTGKGRAKVAEVVSIAEGKKVS